jgi:hypothetical protein
MSLFAATAQKFLAHRDPSLRLPSFALCTCNTTSPSIMQLKSLSSLFKRPEPNTSPAWSDSLRCTLPSNHRLKRYTDLNSVDSWISNELKFCALDGTSPRDMIPCLPHTVITSDLGEWERNRHLCFSHFLPGYPSIAVFSESQSVPVPNIRPPNRSWHPLRLNVRCRWHNCGFQIKSSCTAKASLGSRWEYDIPGKALWYWNASAGLLLVDWNDMYNDMNTDKKRGHVTIKRFRRSEE